MCAKRIEYIEPLVKYQGRKCEGRRSYMHVNAYYCDYILLRKKNTELMPGSGDSAASIEKA